MSTQVPKIRFTQTGVEIPDESVILDGALADIDRAFGGGMNKSLSSPQGQLAQSLTAIIGDKNSQILEVCNQIDPERNDGRWQDAIGNIYFMRRKPGRGTVVQATCSGIVGTVIPAGSLARDASGHMYESLDAAVIGEDGTVVAQFQNREHGPIPCPVNSLTRIYSTVTGWERIDNESAGTLGALQENRFEFEQRRRDSVALGGQGSVESLRAALLAIDGVSDVYVTDNPTSSAVQRGATNYSIDRNSLYVAIIGGSAEDIARTIHRRKSAGCGMAGSVEHTIEIRDGYAPPYPKYTYRWEVPSTVPIYFKVSIVNDDRLPGDIVTRIRESVISEFSGMRNGPRASIGSTVSSGRYYSGVYGISNMVHINSITVGKTAAAGLGQVEMGIDQMPTLSPDDIHVELV